MSRPLIACLGFVAAATWAFAQAAPTFEVAAIRPSSFPAPDYFAGYVAGGGLCGLPRMEQSGSRVAFRKVTLCGLIRFSYDVKDYQVVEMPAWMKREDPSTFFDIDAVSGGRAPAPLEDVRAMVASLLSDRFQLALHRENRELPVYALVVNGNGPKLTGGVHERCRSRMEGRASGGPATCFAMTMTQLSGLLSRETDRAVVDRTGLTERYGFSLEWSRARAPVDGQVSIFTAVQEQLGLKLVPQRLPAEAIIVDRAQRPSQN
jgi:uncharacterized protein (TIGR03435 family)